MNETLNLPGSESSSESGAANKKEDKKNNHWELEWFTDVERGQKWKQLHRNKGYFS